MSIDRLDRLETMTDAELAGTLRIQEKTLVDVAQTFAQRPRATIEPVRNDTPGRRAVEGLGGGTIVSGLAFEKTIGEGGMGIVKLATQRSLGRKVAVKTLRPETRSEAATLRLLREAWVTGALEHPNIVPVYDLGIDEDGTPIIVLKKIEGVEWATVLREPETLRERFGETDRIEHGLRVLVQLCNALALAHTHGVLHRDLKPENVMLGSFGEVYLVDWGIAVSMKDDPTGRFPSVKDAKEIAGTPAYMAPEMLGALGTIDERTDVYLLGAVLHEILTGAPPHQGTFRQIVASILMSEPKYGPDVPRELAEIARRAMSREPAARFASVDEMRQRLEWYLRHRGSLALSREAEKSLVVMQELIGEGNQRTVDEALRDRVYHLFAEARFGFRQAIAASADNDGARRGLRSAIEAVVGFELAAGTAEAASSALAEIEDPSPTLVARVAAAQRAAKRNRAELEKMRAEHDPQTGRRTRLAVGVIAGVSWTIAPLTGPWFEKQVDTSKPGAVNVMYVWTAVMLGIGMAAGRWGRESLSKTLVNRRIRAIATLNFAGQFMIELACDLLHVPWTQMMILHFVVWFIAGSMAAVTIDTRLAPAPALYLGGLVVSALHPELFWYVCALTNLGLVITFVAAWGSLDDAVRRREQLADVVRRVSRRPPPNEGGS